MEIIDEKNQNTNSDKDWENRFNEHIKQRRMGKIFGGIVIVIVGAAMLAREMGVYFPEWLFSWQMLLIVVGLYVGVKHSFRRFGWVVPILIGGAFMFQDYTPYMHIKEYFWPLFIMMIGLVMIFKPRRKWNIEDYHNRHRFNRRMGNRHFCSYKEGASSSEDSLNMDIVFSGFKKNVISKDFKGGRISCVFGGGDLNLSQADINGTVILELEQIFGGVKIIVPANWEVQTGEMQTIFGGVDDKRPTQGSTHNPDKVLVIKGSVVFGGIDIRSY
jgi:predicted membrane protein